MLPFSMDELSEAVHDGLVTARTHPYLPLTIYNYSPEVQYRNYWNDITLNCRGLILDFEGNIVARPWKKFFNLGQVNLPIQLTDPVEVMDKADGSLGILYKEETVRKWNGGNPIDVDYYAIATRGSFKSEQAIHATEIWDEKYGHLEPLDGYTILFEIIYPGNRIVLNYDGMDDLVLLGAVENETGFYHGPNTAKYLFKDDAWSGPVIEVFPFNTISDALGHMARENAEGYVIRSHNFMVKLKQPDYLELHRLVTNMTPKSIWEQLRDGKGLDGIVSALPDEFHSMAKDIAEPMIARYNERLDEILDDWGNLMIKLPLDASRKEIAKVFTKHKDAKYYFSLLDNRPIGPLVWAELKPKETVSISED